MAANDAEETWTDNISARLGRVTDAALGPEDSRARRGIEAELLGEQRQVLGLENHRLHHARLLCVILPVAEEIQLPPSLAILRYASSKES